MCFVWIWEQTAIISLYTITWLVCIIGTESDNYIYNNITGVYQELCVFCYLCVEFLSQSGIILKYVE